MVKELYNNIRGGNGYKKMGLIATIVTVTTLLLSTCLSMTDTRYYKRIEANAFEVHINESVRDIVEVHRNTVKRCESTDKLVENFDKNFSEFKKESADLSRQLSEMNGMLKILLLRYGQP